MGKPAERGIGRIVGQSLGVVAPPPSRTQRGQPQSLVIGEPVKGAPLGSAPVGKRLVLSGVGLAASDSREVLPSKISQVVESHADELLASSRKLTIGG